MVRINKFLALCELGSRRKVEELINGGKVTVNGQLCTDLATQIDPQNDLVRVNSSLVKYNQNKVFIMLNKPAGYIVTRNDEHHRKTIYDLLPEMAAKLHPIGRLDHDSEGLILLTNDGDITNKIIHPSTKIEKTYKVTVKGKIDFQKLTLLRNGIEIDDYKTQPAKVFLKHSTDEHSELRMTITEGKNRQIRKMLEAIGHPVLKLKRLQIGNIKLEKLPTGTWRFLNDKEVLYLVKIKQRRSNETRHYRLYQIRQNHHF
jgi:23S rRNA pseudouridine2605 synthase